MLVRQMHCRNTFIPGAFLLATTADSQDDIEAGREGVSESARTADAF